MLHVYMCLECFLNKLFKLSFALDESNAALLTLRHHTPCAKKTTTGNSYYLPRVCSPNSHVQMNIWLDVGV